MSEIIKNNTQKETVIEENKTETENILQFLKDQRDIKTPKNEVENKTDILSSEISSNDTKNDNKIDENVDNMHKENEDENETVYTIALPDVLDVCEQFLNNEINREDFTKWLDRIKIRTYIPMVEKILIVSNLLYLDRVEEDGGDPSWLIGELEQEKFWYALLRYTNIEINGYDAYINTISYDTLYQSIGGLLIAMIGFDYDQIIKMIDDSMNYLRIHEILQVFDKFDAEHLDKYGQDVKEQLEYFDKHKDTLESLSQIFANQVFGVQTQK